jgi:hypothetical protein
MRQTERPPLLLTEAQLRDYGSVSFDVCFVEISELPAAAADHLEQATSGVVVLAMQPQVLCEVVDLLREQRYLNLGRPCVHFVALVLDDDFAFSLD